MLGVILSSTLKFVMPLSLTIRWNWKKKYPDGISWHMLYFCPKACYKSNKPLHLDCSHSIRWISHISTYIFFNFFDAIVHWMWFCMNTWHCSFVPRNKFIWQKKILYGNLPSIFRHKKRWTTLVYKSKLLLLCKFIVHKPCSKLNQIMTCNSLFWILLL